MDGMFHPKIIGWGLILLVFFYTIYLVRSGRLSAHLAVNWVIAELAFMLVMFFDGIRALIRSALGEESAAFSLILLGMIWFVFLMLEGLTRISALTAKLKEVNQEVALLRERLVELSRELDSRNGIK